MVPDADLLARFAKSGDQAAFELILWRHGPMVWGVCRRVLAHTQDAEDAFQATFLVLARQAATVREGIALASWLYRVAHRAALAARTARRRTVLSEITTDFPTHATADDPARIAARGELATLLDDEIARLPERFRRTFILCELEGLSRIEAAAKLQCPVGTIESRLHRARSLLRSRLARRGVALPGVLLIPAVPAALRAATLHHVAAPAAAVGLPAALLAEKALRSLALGTLKKCLAGVLAACLLVTGVSLAALRPNACPVDSEPPDSPPAPLQPAARAEANKEPLPVEAVARVGSPRLRHGDSIADIAYSADGKWIASVAHDGSARVWDGATGHLCLRVPLKGTPGNLFRVAITPDSKSVVIVDNTSCRIVDVRTGKEQASHPHPQGDSALVAEIAPDGSLFATAQSGKNLSVYDIRTGKERYSLPVKTTWGRSVAFSADARAIVVSSSHGNKGESGELHVFDATTGKPLLSVNEEKRRLGAPALTPDGKTVAALSSLDSGDEAVVLWEVGSGKLLRCIKGLERTASCIAFSPDGKLLAVGNVQRLWLQLFEVVTGKEVRRLHCWPSVMTIAFSPDGKTLAAGKSEGTISLWDVTTGKPRPASPDPDGGAFHLRFTDGSNNLLVVAGDITVRDWRTGRISRRYPDPRKDMFMGLSVSPDGEMLAVCAEDGIVRLVDARTGKDLHVLKGHRIAADKTLFAPDGRCLFSMSYDKTVRVWDVATGKQLHCLDIGELNSFSELAVSSDGKVLAALCPTAPGAPSEIRVWDTRSGTELHRLAVSGGTGRALAFSPDGSRLACAGQPVENGHAGDTSGIVLLWDVATGRQLRSFAGHQATVHDVTFSPDGCMLATCGHDHTVRLWEVASGKERHRFTGHDSPVFRVVFSPDGRFLASSSADAPVFVWEVAGIDHRTAPTDWSAGERDRLWQELANPEAAAAFKTMRQLLASPEEAVRLFRKRLKPAAPRDEGRLQQLVRDLADDDFETRERATAALKKVAGDIEGMLRREREKTQSPEARRRLDDLLTSAEEPTPERLRQSRSVEVLERLAVPEAATLLERLSAGGAGSRLTDEAAAALHRVRHRAGY
jgi:RNA polymerase sigma factor (sigma-70 family)